MQKTILVTGANGQLGSCLRDLSQGSSHKFIFTDIEQLDITSIDAVASFFEAQKPHWVINCAAYTAVDKAEGEPEAAMLINATAAGILATQSAKVGASIVHISTDYVFKGDDAIPRTEDDATEPQSVYGRTKLEGEKLVASGNEKHIILRTSWLYSVYGRNFVKTMRSLGGERASIDVVSDQWGSPTSAHDLASAIMGVINKPIYGLYHYCNEGTTSWALFAQDIMDLSGINCTVNHITSDKYPTVAKRPHYSLMSRRKFCDTFGVDIPEWEASLEDMIGKFSKEN